ncbi:hypothetical protein [Gordonia sp. NPDC003376]
MSDSVDDRRTAAAQAYIDALVTHDPSSVPLHPHCTRVEFGIKTGRNGHHIARSLARGPQFKIIHAVGDLTSEVTGHTVTTRYWVHLRPRIFGLAAPVSETFVVDDAGRIRTIVARFGLPRRRV